ncbi:MAG: hypothetical protein Kow0069_26340 [Promethearchaeota archaeon]
MSDNPKPNLEEINSKLAAAELEEIDYYGGLEILLDAFASKITELFGRNSLLAMTYQVGSRPGELIAQRLLNSRGGKLFDDPIEAFVTLFTNVPRFFHVKLKSIEKEENGSVCITFDNECFFRPVILHREALTLGGPLCRVNKGYMEVALQRMTGWKVTVKRVGASNGSEACEEQVTFKPPVPV